MATVRASLGEGNIHPLPPGKAPAPAMGILHLHQLFCQRKQEQPHVERPSPRKCNRSSLPPAQFYSLLASLLPPKAALLAHGHTDHSGWHSGHSMALRFCIAGPMLAQGLSAAAQTL